MLKRATDSAVGGQGGIGTQDEKRLMLLFMVTVVTLYLQLTHAAQNLFSGLSYCRFLVTKKLH